MKNRRSPFIYRILFVFLKMVLVVSGHRYYKLFTPDGHQQAAGAHLLLLYNRSKIDRPSSGNRTIGYAPRKPSKLLRLKTLKNAQSAQSASGRTYAR